MRWRWLAPALWSAFIFGSSCTVIFRSTWLDTVHRAAPRVATRAQLDGFWDSYGWVFVKGFHMLEYAILFALVWWAARTKAQIGAVLAVWLSVVAFAVTDEYHQTFVPQRGGRWTDVVIDAGGATLAASAVILDEALRRRRFRQKILDARY